MEGLPTRLAARGAQKNRPGGGPEKQEIRGQTVRWPVSRVLFRFPGDGYSSSAAVAGRVEQPTRTAAQDRACRAGRHVSLHGLAPDGVYHARPVAGPAVRSYRTFSPLPPESGGLFSVALSLGSLPAGVTRHPDPVERGGPDFPLPEPRITPRAGHIRPSDSAGIKAAAITGVRRGNDYPRGKSNGNVITKSIIISIKTIQNHQTMEIKLKNREVIAVYTSHGLRDFELLGGTSKWKVNVARATACRFVICAKNSGSCQMRMASRVLFRSERLF